MPDGWEFAHQLRAVSSEGDDGACKRGPKHSSMRCPIRTSLTRRGFASILGGGAAALIMPRLGSGSVGGTSNKRPNIIFLFADDQRFDTIHALGSRVIRTPNLDSLVENGMTFTHTFASIPMCTPSRAELLTGCSGFRSGVRFFGEKINPSLPTWPHAMVKNGYVTWFTGKWHNDGTPQTRGFQEARRVFLGGMSNHVMTFKENGRKVAGFSSELFADAALEKFELYNLETDLKETTDLSAEEPARLKQMCAVVKKLHKRIEADPLSR